MSMHFEFYKLNRVDYVDGQYVLLYPQLNEYWNKSLAEMPDELQVRVGLAVNGWDQTACQYYSEQRNELVMLRQECIKKYDMQRDITQERETYIALRGYLGGDERFANSEDDNEYESDECYSGELFNRIKRARSQGSINVANFLTNEVLIPLQHICDEFGIHWSNPEPLLWRAICEYRWCAMRNVIAKAKREKSPLLNDEINDVKTYLYRIINLDRVRIRDVWNEQESNFGKNSKSLKVEKFAARLSSNSDVVVNDSVSVEMTATKHADLLEKGMVKDLQKNNAKCLTRSRKPIIMREQENAVLQWLSDQGYAPFNLPPIKNGTAGLRKACADTLFEKYSELFGSKKLVQRAWERLQEFEMLGKQEEIRSS